MACPFLQEVRMVSCEASPFGKPLRADSVSSVSPCAGEDYARCPYFQEALARERRGLDPPAPGRRHPVLAALGGLAVLVVLPLYGALVLVHLAFAALWRLACAAEHAVAHASHRLHPHHGASP